MHHLAGRVQNADVASSYVVSWVACELAHRACRRVLALQSGVELRFFIDPSDRPAAYLQSRRDRGGDRWRGRLKTGPALRAYAWLSVRRRPAVI